MFSTYPLHLRRRSLLWWPLGLALPAAAQPQPGTLAVIGKDGYLFAGWGAGGTPDWAGIDATVARVAEVRKLLVAKGITLVVPVIPEKMGFYEDKLPDGTTLTPAMRSRYGRILEKLRAADVPTFDGDAPLRALQKQGQEVYYRTDQHWTQPAADAMAQGAADLIRSLVPNLAGAAGSGIALGLIANERRFGDLADRFLSADQRKAVGREIFSVRRAVEADIHVSSLKAAVEAVVAAARGTPAPAVEGPEPEPAFARVEPMPV